MNSVLLLPAIGIVLSLLQSPPEKKPSPKDAIPAALDRYLDTRWSAAPDATEKLVKQIKDAGLDAAAVEELLRKGRAGYPEPAQKPGRLTSKVPLECEHVDYSTEYYIYVPESYDPKVAVPLVIVGHGGNGAMPKGYAAQAAKGGTHPYWTEPASRLGFIVVAPLSERGWGGIGNSIVLSLLSKVQREYAVDPDRVYVTGHSMGGHLSWRSGIYMPDRWGAVGPMSGGYDFVESKEVWSLFNIPGYATYGAQEPYNINKFNNRIRDWMEERDYPWVMMEKEGGHEIFADELPKVARFFLDNPRDLYRTRVVARGGGTMVFDDPGTNEKWGKNHTWKSGRAIPASTFHWIRLVPLPSDTPKEKTFQELRAENKGKNVFELTTQNVRKVRIYLHPKMVDFKKPVVVIVNGKEAYNARVTPDLRTMLELVREFDDRGRIFHAAIDLEIKTDGEIAEPTYAEKPPEKADESKDPKEKTEK